MSGINVDVINNPPTIAELQAFSIDAVRLVSKPDPNGPGVHPVIEQYLADLKTAGIFALVVVTSESEGRLPANNHGWVQCHNQPTDPAVDSELMTPDQYVEEFNTWSETFPQFNWVAAGLDDGDFSATFWRAVCPRLVNCVGFALQPYGQVPDDAVALVKAHQAVDPSKLAFVTEFNCTAAEIAPMLDGLKAVTAGQYWFAWNDNVPTMGLSDHPDKAAAWQEAMIPAPPVAEPELWVDLANYQRELTQAMVDDMKAANVVGICSQAITGLDGRSFTRQQLTFGQANGFKLAGYVWCFGGVSVARRLPMFDGFPLEWLALDVEQDGLTIANVNRDLSLCDAYTGQTSPIYGGKWFWDRRGWTGLATWASRGLWDAGYNFIQDLDSGFVPYGGWGQRWGHQFSDKAVFGGVAFDLSVVRA